MTKVLWHQQQRAKGETKTAKISASKQAETSITGLPPSSLAPCTIWFSSHLRNFLLIWRKKILSHRFAILQIEIIITKHFCRLPRCAWRRCRLPKPESKTWRRGQAYHYNNIILLHYYIIMILQYYIIKILHYFIIEL